MIDALDWLSWSMGLAIGLLVGGLAALLWRNRRGQTLRIDNEVLRTRLKTDATLSAERDIALAHAREQLQGVFGELARDSLHSNSELFLQLARERLSRQHADASQVLKERETAIESMVRPIREALAKTEAQIQSIERDRIDSFATIKAQMEILASGQTHLSRETRNLVFGEHFGKLGRTLSSSVDSNNKAVGSLEQQVLPAARKFPELGLRVTRELAIMEPIANLARMPCGVADGVSEDGVPENT